MFSGILQLAKRSSQEESTRLSQHITRLLLGSILLCVFIEAHVNSAKTARGLPIFRSQILLTHLFLIINAIFGYSQVIVEERESGAIDLLKLAGIDRASILIGKTLPRIWESALLIGVQFPFTLLTITLGGVSWTQVSAAYVALFACLTLVAGIGVFASTMSHTGRSAVFLATTIMFVYLFPFVSPFVSWGTMTFGWSERINLQSRTLTIMQTGFNESPWCDAVYSAAFLGVLAMIVSWILFDVPTNRAYFRLAGRFKNRPRRLRRSRVWSNPWVWKEYVFLSGGVRRMLMRTAVHIGLLIWMCYAQRGVSRGFAWAALLGCPVSLIDGTWTAGRLFADEIRNQTWSVLVQTPNSLTRIAVNKAIGWTIGMMPSILLPLIFILLAIVTHQQVSLDNASELIIGTLVTTIAVFAYLHMMVLFSLDWHWKAIPVTLISTCVLTYLYMWMLVPWRSPSEVRCDFFVFTGIVLLGLIAGFQYQIHRRLRILAGSS